MLLVSEPTVGEPEKAALHDVIDSGWITMGPRVRSFEESFASLHGLPDAVAVSSCTAALHLILLAAGIGPGDEVLVPSLTFAASANAVLYVGATPVFVDIESLDVPLVSVARAEERCTSRTRAAIVVHYAGALAGTTWREFADRRGLFLVEDSAHAVGFRGPGMLGDAAAFSFYGNKNMSCESFIKSLELVMLGEFVVQPLIWALDHYPFHDTDRAETAQAIAPDQSVPLSMAIDGSAVCSPDAEEGSGTGISALSARQKTILQCLIEGDSNKLIARKFLISEGTVKAHMKLLLRKIHVRNRTQAAIWGLNQLPRTLIGSPDEASDDIGSTTNDDGEAFASRSEAATL